MWESYVQPYSKPCPSPFWNTSTRRVYGGSGRAVTPKLSMCSSSPVGGRGMSIPPRNPLAMALLYLLLAVVAGGALPFQAGINARLAAFVGGPIRASMISFAVGTLV